jgi:hypothetical protein
MMEDREFSFQRGKKFLLKDAHQFWGSPSIPSSGYKSSFPGVKRPGLEADHSLPYTVEVKE